MDAQQQTIAILMRIASLVVLHIHADAEVDTLVMERSVMVTIRARALLVYI